jgi:uncharacterized protein YjbJ (UPF0337 family)
LLTSSGVAPYADFSIPLATFGRNMKEHPMGKLTDKMNAAGNKAAGNTKEAIGKATGDEALRARGAAQELKGEVQSVKGDVEGALGDDI